MENVAAETSQTDEEPFEVAKPYENASENYKATEITEVLTDYSNVYLLEIEVVSMVEKAPNLVRHDVFTTTNDVLVAVDYMLGHHFKVEETNVVKSLKVVVANFNSYSTNLEN